MNTNEMSMLGPVQNDVFLFCCLSTFYHGEKNVRIVFINTIIWKEKLKRKFYKQTAIVDRDRKRKLFRYGGLDLWPICSVCVSGFYNQTGVADWLQP